MVLEMFGATVSPYACQRTMSTQKTLVKPAKITHIAKRLRADPRSVRKVLCGHEVRGAVGQLIEDELKRLGLI